MKAYKSVEIPARIEQRLAYIQCDLCGETTTREWKTGSFDATETEIRMKTGNSYPEGGSGEETEIDICPACFENKLIPWVRSQGGEPSITEWDW